MFRDSDVEVDIIWYPAPPGAKAYPGDMFLHQSIWDRDPDGIDEYHDGLGEVWDAKHVTSHMRPVAGTGTGHYCGTAEEFANGATYNPDANYPMRPDGLPVCCGPVDRGGFLMGGRMPPAPHGGLEMGGSMPPRVPALVNCQPIENFGELGTVYWKSGTGFGFTWRAAMTFENLPAGTYHVQYWVAAPLGVTAVVREGPSCTSLATIAFESGSSGCLEFTTSGQQKTFVFCDGGTYTAGFYNWFRVDAGPC